MASNDLYGAFGSVPDKVSVTGTGGSPLSVRADANDFGAQIGAGMQNLGAAIGQIGEQADKKAQKERDIINRTLATEAEIKYASELAGISVNYKSLPGLKSYEQLPQYTAQVTGLRQKYAESLPESARQEFDFIAMNHEKNALVDANRFAYEQARVADLQSAANAISMSVTQAGYKPVAQDDFRFGQTLGDIEANIARQFSDAPGVTVDERTGRYNFSDTPEAQQTQEAYGKALDDAVGKAWMSRFQTLAGDDPIWAFEKYKIDKDEIPAQFQIALDAFFYPRVRDAEAGNIAGAEIQRAQTGYSEAYAKTGKPDAISVIMKNELHGDGTIRVHADGDGQAIGGINSDAFPEQFAEASRLLRDNGQEAARDYIKDFYQKQIIEANGIDRLPTNVQEIVADGVVNHWSGFQKELISAAKNGASPQELIAMRRKEYDRLVATGEKKYTDAAEGWNRRLDSFGVGVGDPGFVRPPTEADYYKENYDSILNKARIQAENQRPGDAKFADLAEQKAKNHLDQVIRQQDRQYSAATKKLYQATTGALTKGERPTSMDAIKAISPEMKNLVDDVMINQPQVYNTIDRQMRAASNARKTVMPAAEKIKIQNEIFTDIGKWMISQKDGKSVIGNEAKTDMLGRGDTSPLEDLMRLQNKIGDAMERGVPGLEKEMNQATSAVLSYIANEQGADDKGYVFWNGEKKEPYDVGYQVVLDFLEKPENSDIKDDDWVKNQLFRDFIRLADQIPEEVKRDGLAYQTKLDEISQSVVNNYGKRSVAALRQLPEMPTGVVKSDGSTLNLGNANTALKPDVKISDEVRKEEFYDEEPAYSYYKDGQLIRVEILNPDGTIKETIQ